MADRSTETFMMSRVFDAPRETVWKAWTEPERLKHWWGPKGARTTASTVDLRPGGLFHYRLQMPGRPEMWGKIVYREIVEPERLVGIMSFSDEKGGVTQHPLMPSWPRETISTVTFDAQGAKTRIGVRWAPHAATDVERKTFEAGHQSMQQGWTGTFDQLAQYLRTGGKEKEGETMQIQPYLFFEGRCEEALEFYKKALGAEVAMLMRFKESPEPAPPGMLPPGSENKVMHATFRVGNATVMVSDGRCQGRPGFQGFSLSLTVPDEARAEKVFAALGEGGQVQMPLAKTFWSPRFGMVADRFGVSWMISVAH